MGSQQFDLLGTVTVGAAYEAGARIARVGAVIDMEKLLSLSPFVLLSKASDAAMRQTAQAKEEVV